MHEQCDDIKEISEDLNYIKEDILEMFEKLSERIAKRFWGMAGLFVGLFILFGGMIIDTKAESQNHVTKQEISEYVTTEEMISFMLLEMSYVKRIILLEKAEVSDSMINHVFDNHEWILRQFMEYNPRSADKKPDYARILNEYKKQE